jgi:hypothetical protein
VSEPIQEPKLEPVAFKLLLETLEMKGAALRRDTDPKITTADELAIFTQLEILTPEIVMTEPDAMTC